MARYGHGKVRSEWHLWLEQADRAARTEGWSRGQRSRVERSRGVRGGLRTFECDRRAVRAQDRQAERGEAQATTGPADRPADRRDARQPFVGQNLGGHGPRAGDDVEPTVRDPGRVPIQRRELLVRLDWSGRGPPALAIVELLPGDVPIDRQVHRAGARASSAPAGVTTRRTLVVDRPQQVRDGQLLV